MANYRNVDRQDNSTLEDPPTHPFWNLFGCCMRRKYASVRVEDVYRTTLEEFEFDTNKFRKIRFIMPIQNLMDGKYERVIFNPDYENLWNPSYKEIIRPRTSNEPDTPIASDSGYMGTSQSRPSTSGTQKSLLSVHASSSGTQQHSTQASSSGTQQYSTQASSSDTQQYSTQASSSDTQQYSTQASSSGKQQYSTQTSSSGTRLSAPSKQQLSTDASSLATQTSPEGSTMGSTAGSTLATQTPRDYGPPLLWPPLEGPRTTQSDRL